MQNFRFLQLQESGLSMSSLPLSAVDPPKMLLVAVHSHCDLRQVLDQHNQLSVRLSPIRAPKVQVLVFAISPHFIFSIQGPLQNVYLYREEIARKNGTAQRSILNKIKIQEGIVKLGLHYNL
ncbi:MAG: hypothetical protein EZS28_037548 [Streblomastix strix]|uniref:Uncharacterized protein n=1 Tax=Streblomastix strix TaxID=222440 RepID=A0A5J4UBC3_9EUKA|nr:MAG: hypothetical protein EZS28_037548 [Streblomastix strix]